MTLSLRPFANNPQTVTRRQTSCEGRAIDDASKIQRFLKLDELAADVLLPLMVNAPNNRIRHPSRHTTQQQRPQRRLEAVEVPGTNELRLEPAEDEGYHDRDARRDVQGELDIVRQGEVGDHREEAACVESLVEGEGGGGGRDGGCTTEEVRYSHHEPFDWGLFGGWLGKLELEVHHELHSASTQSQTYSH